MKRVLLLGAGGCAARGVAKCLELVGDYVIFGADTGSLPPRELFSHPLYSVSPPDTSLGDESLLKTIAACQPDVIHAQPDEEVARISRMRSEIRKRGCAVFLPRADVIKTCQDKWQTYEALRKCKVPVPDTALGCHELWPAYKMLHLRPRKGAGGKGSLRTSDRRLAGRWIKGREREFTVAECKDGPTVTWQGVFCNGTLYASQQRTRLAWTHGDRGSCLVGETYSSAAHEEIANAAVRAVDLFPHGIYGVDMVMGKGEAFVTEINIGRFFTTIEFFARLGLNMPDLAMKLALNEPVEQLGRNPLRSGSRWIRSFDAAPVLVQP